MSKGAGEKRPARKRKSPAVSRGKDSRKSFAEKAYDKLEEMIVLAELQPRVMYSVNELVEATGSTRTPVREALLRLSQEGMVTIIRRRGVRINDVDFISMMHLLETRRPLQSLAVGLIALRASERQRDYMHNLARELSETGTAGPPDKARLLATIRQAHECLCEAIDNPFLSRTLRIVQSLSRRYWLYYLKPVDVSRSLGLHRKLLSSIADGDVDKAVRLSEEQLNYLEEYARGTVRWGEGGSSG